MIKYLIIDVDGTLTDGGVYYDDNGNELKKFCTRDGTGIVLTKAAGIEPIILTGRECNATTRRMKELGIQQLNQNVKDKVLWLKQWIEENKIKKEQIGYIGDDVNDINPMKLCGFIACPADACDEVKKIADYVSALDGGRGVVRDVIKKILSDEGRWEEVLHNSYGTGI